MTASNTSSLGRWADEDEEFDVDSYVRATAHYSAPEHSPGMASFHQVAARPDGSAESRGAEGDNEIDASDFELDENVNVENAEVDDDDQLEDSEEDEEDDEDEDDSYDDEDDDEDEDSDDDEDEVAAHARHPPMQPRAPRPYYPSHEVVANMLLYGLANTSWSMDRLPRAAVYEDPTPSTTAAVGIEDTRASGETDSNTTPRAPVPAPWGPIVWPRWYNHQRWRNIKESMGYPMNRPMSWPSRLHTMELAEETSPTTDSGSSEPSPHDSTGETSTDATSPILEESANEGTGLGIQVDEDFVLYPGCEIYLDAIEPPQSQIRAEELEIPDNWDDQEEPEEAHVKEFTKDSDDLPSDNTNDADQKLSLLAELDTNDSPSDLPGKISDIWDDDDDDFDIEAYMQKPPPPPPTLEELGPLQQQADNNESVYEVRLPDAKSIVPCNSESETTVAPEELESGSSADAHADSTTYDTAADATTVDAATDSATVDTTTVVESGNHATETANSEDNTPTDNGQANTPPAQPREKEREWKVWLLRFKRRGRLAGGNELHEYILYRWQCIDDGEFLERNKYCAIWNDYKRFAGLRPLDILNPSPLRKEIVPEEAENVTEEEEEEVVPMPESMKKMGREGLRTRGVLSMVDICGERAQNVSLRSGITVSIQVMDHFGPRQAKLVKEVKLELVAAEAADAAELDADIVEQTVKDPIAPDSAMEDTEATELDTDIVVQVVEEAIRRAPLEEIIEVADLCDEVVGDARHSNTDAGIVEPTEEVAALERTSKKSTRKVRKPKKPQSRNRDPETLTFCTKCKTTLLGKNRREAALHINTCTGPAKDDITDYISSAVAKDAAYATEDTEPRVDSATPSEHSSRPPSPATPETPSQPQPHTSHARLTATTIGLGRRQPMDPRALLVPTTQSSEQDTVPDLEVTKPAFGVEKADSMPWIHIPSIFTAGFSLGVGMAALGWM